MARPDRLHSSASGVVPLSAYWFALNLQTAVLLTIVVPAELLRMANTNHTALLARLAVLSGIVSMVVPPLVGWVSDVVRPRVARKSFVLVGSAVNVVALLWMANANQVGTYTLAFLLVTFGENASLAAFEAIMPEVVSEDTFGVQSGAMGVATLAGSVAGLAVAGLFGPGPALVTMAVSQALATAITMRIQETGVEARRRPAPHVSAFGLVFVGRFAILFGLTLLMTFVLYFFRDVLGAANPSAGTATVAGVALLAAVVASVIGGKLADRLSRPRLAALSGLPMAAAALGFAFFPSLGFILVPALLYGLGYGAYLSSDWALAITSLPNRSFIGRDLGVFNIASTLPGVVAPALGGIILTTAPSPAVGYHELFLLAGAAFLFGSLVVLGIRDETTGSTGWSTPLAVLIALVLYVYVHLAYRPRLFGRLPRTREGLLLLANHQHDMEGMILPAILYLDGPLTKPFHAAGSRRLFEPGFLYERSPAWLAPLVAPIPLAAILRRVGILPIENTPRSRSLTSLGYEIFRLHGDLPLSEVFSPETLAELEEKAHVRVTGLRLSALWGRRLRAHTRTPVPQRALKEPYRSEVRERLRSELEAEMSALEAALTAGGTLYLTPEGRISEDGRLGRLKEALDRLLPVAEKVYLAIVAYDPFLPGRLPFYARILGPVPHDPEVVRELFLHARPVTVSQLAASFLVGNPGPFTRNEFVAAIRTGAAALPPAAFRTPPLSNPERAALLALDALTERGFLTVGSDGRYRRTEHVHDPRFPLAPDMVLFQANVYAEVLEGEDRLAACHP